MELQDSAFPLLRGIMLGFTDASAGYNRPVNFNGIDNYTRLAGDELFWSSFRIGIIWAVSVTLLQFLASLGLALLLNANLRFRAVARTLALVPWAIPPVIIAIMWRLMLNPTAGPVDKMMGSVGATAQAYLRVPIGVAISVVFLGETLAPTAWLGLAGVVIGVAAMTLPAPR
mgnify:CR=1 FL=1